ncbi:MAG TPA: hypothetical protein VFZ40_09360 [Pyrinomonadaceae bacterium]
MWFNRATNVIETGYPIGETAGSATDTISMIFVIKFNPDAFVRRNPSRALHSNALNALDPATRSTPSTPDG